MRERPFSVSAKLWAFACVLLGSTLTTEPLQSALLSCGALFFLALQRKWRRLASCALFCLALGLLLYAIRRHGLRMPLFSEFYVLLFWTLTPVFLLGWDLITTPPGELSAFLSCLRSPRAFILGLLVLCRFFPTLKAELRGVGRSMRNRGLLAPARLLAHPLLSCEYVLVPLLLRILQIADRLSISALARGAEHPGPRGSYHGRPTGLRDRLAMALWTLLTAGFLLWGGVGA